MTLFPYQFVDNLVFFIRYRPAVSAFTVARASVIEQLQKQPGKQMVMVRYTPDHNFHEEWIYNRADIDASPIVWAREMSPEQDAPFLAYYRDRQPDRKIWLLEPDMAPPRLNPYPGKEIASR